MGKVSLILRRAFDRQAVAMSQNDSFVLFGEVVIASLDTFVKKSGIRLPENIEEHLVT